MAESEGISLDHLQVLAARAGLQMSREELAALKPMYDHYARQITRLFAADLGAEDLAVVYSPNWDSQS
jgi:hypothetical protein